MENTKAKKLLIGVLLVLLVACLGVIVWQYVKLNSQSASNDAVASEKENVGSTNTDVTNKEPSNTTPNTNNETKDEEIKTETVSKNKYVYFNKDKVKISGKYVSDSSLKLAEVIVNLFDEENTLSYTVTEKGGVKANYNGNTYTVKGLSKKVVEICSVNDGQSAMESGIALMEDGTIEQLYLDGSEFKSYGTISGVKDVVRFIYVLKDNHRSLAAVQADGSVVVFKANASKLKVDGNYSADSSLKLAEVIVNLFDEENTLSYTVTEKGGVKANYNGNTYTVKGLSKKVVEICSVNDGQSAIETGIATMEDGTIEQLYLDGSEFKSYGTISGVKDVERFIHILKDNHRYLAALQADGDVVVLQGLKNYYNPGM